MTCSIPRSNAWRARRWLACAGVVLGAAVLMAADMRVTPISTDGRVFASVAASSAYTADLREAVQSGLPVTLTFVIDLKRPSTVWFDRTVTTTTVASMVKFDNLTRQYQVSKLSEGRVVSSQRTESEDEMRAWVTEFEHVPLSDGDSMEPNAEYYVRVRIRSSPHRSFFLWPWSRDDADVRADFTYIR
jgi:hypothetical protein